MTAYKVSPAFRILVASAAFPVHALRDVVALPTSSTIFPTRLTRATEVNARTDCRTSFSPTVLPNYGCPPLSKDPCSSTYLRIICDGAYLPSEDLTDGTSPAVRFSNPPQDKTVPQQRRTAERREPWPAKVSLIT
jgi:hypothetical protein